ncbi:diacylglycerol kinase [Streptomyces sp. bgisy154]|uniref:diacylglycerol kinase n=1 Tax=Streptomyces sp. bgisy154 TaxID=3413794 RepID=UPI003D7523E2
MATFATSEQLLVVIDPLARQADGESVRIAKDVLSAGAATKVCLPEGPQEFARALARRGARRPVVVGDDQALVRAVGLLHRQRELAGCALSMVPVGGVLSLAGALGVPTGAVAAARAVLEGAERRLDLLVDDSDGVVLGGLRIPPVGFPEAGASPAGATAVGATAVGATAVGPGGSAGPPGDGDDDTDDSGDLGGVSRPWLRTCRSLVRTLVPGRPARAATAPGPSRLRVEVDGETLVDLDQPLEAVSVTPGGSGLVQVEVQPVSVGAEAVPLLARGHRVTVSGADFRYRADSGVTGPVRRRTWTVRESALGLVLPPTA